MQDPFLTGSWSSKHHPIKIAFNENVWRLINDGHDNAHGALFGLFSESDGASFSLDFAIKEPNLDYNYHFAESEFFARMFNLDNDCEKLEQITLQFDELSFECGRYRFHNEKYGEQMVTRAMHIDKDFVIGVGLAWPISLPLDNDLPIKFNALLNALSLPKQNQNL